MKTLLFILMVMIPLPGLAEIYKCKDARQTVVYQDTPCTTRTIGMIKPVPAPSQKDELQAKQNLERMIRSNRDFDVKRLAEWEKRKEELRLLEAEEMRERERMAAEDWEDESWSYIPLYGPGYGYGHGHRLHSRHPHPDRHPGPVVSPVRRDRPCVIGYIGDKSCR